MAPSLFHLMSSCQLCQPASDNDDDDDDDDDGAHATMSTVS